LGHPSCGRLGKPNSRRKFQPVSVSAFKISDLFIGFTGQRFSILAFDFEILPGSLSAFSVSDFQCLIGLFLLSQFQLCFLPWVFSLVRCISAVNKE
jgi:hypothetical protein